MNDKFSSKDPRSLKPEIEKLISFEEKDDLLRAQKKAEDKAGLFSKYATILSCSFVKQTKEASAEEGIEAPKGGFFRAT